MSLQIWLPLKGNLKNYGLSDLEFSITNTSTTTIAPTGKIGSSSYNNNSHSSGGLVSNKTIDLGNELSMFCWMNFTTLTSSSNLTAIGGQHRHPSNCGMGITMRYVSSTTGYLSVNTGDGSSRTYNTYYGKTLLMANTWYHVGFTYDGTNIKLYVNGNLDGTFSYPNQLNVDDYIQLFAWSFGATTGSGLYGGYCFNGNINDYRVYDHCLAEKEVKLLSQGLIAHYSLRETDLENTTNIITYPFSKGAVTTDWDASLHQNAISVDGWTAGYNGGVSEPTIGYHAHWKIIDGLSTLVMPNLNSEIGRAGRWLGCSSHGIQEKVGPSTTYTISFDAKGSVDNMLVRAGYYYRLTNASSNAFHDGFLEARLSKQWHRYTKTFTTNSALNTSISSPIYIYGHNDSAIEGTSYIRNIQVEVKDHATGYTTTSRTVETIPDSSGYGNNGTIISSTNGLILDYDSIRNNTCIKFDGSTAIICGTEPKVTDAITVNIWGYMDDWSIYNNNTQRLISCTEGGGWNFEPSGGKMQFPIGTGTSSNTYKTVKSTTNLASLSAGWHMFTGTYDGLNLKIYIDGKLENTSIAYTTHTPIYYHTSNAIFIGAEAGDSATKPAGSYFIGKISDVRIYAKPLTENEVLDLYQARMSITSCGDIISYDYTEEGCDNVKFTSDGLTRTGNIAEIGPLYDMETKALDDGSTWARIHWLDVTNRKNWFANAAEVAECVNEVNRYSRMGIVDKFKGQRYEITNLMKEINTTNYTGGTVSTTYRKYGTALYLTGTTTAAEVYINTAFTIPYIQGHIYYGRAEILQETVQGGCDLYWKVAEPRVILGPGCSAAKTWTVVSGRRTPEQVAATTGADWESGDYTARFDYNNSKVAGTMWFDGFMLIDLTATFGAGKEPSQAWCDANIPYFTGTKMIEIDDEDYGWYEFMLTYPSLSITEYNRWKQTSSPNESTVVNYTPINIAWSAHSNGIRKHGSNNVYNCDSGSTWYAPIGQTATWTSEKYIPAADGTSQTSTELWVRIDNLSKLKKISIFDEKYIQGRNILEL